MARSRYDVDNGSGRYARPRPSMRWELGSSAGFISGLIVIAGTALLVASGRFDVARNLSHLVPASIRSFMESERPLSPPYDVVETVVGKVQTIGPSAQRQGGRKASFGIGDSQDTVLRIQGEPDLRSGSVWHYGSSRVTFIAGRVAGWHNSSANPLHVR